MKLLLVLGATVFGIGAVLAAIGTTSMGLFLFYCATMVVGALVANFARRRLDVR